MPSLEDQETTPKSPTNGRTSPLRGVRFIDLFAGLGGFHVGLAQLGAECVFASELNENLRVCYNMNFGMQPAGDIRKIDIQDIPSHDILCAGFPCQPFSKAGEQLGTECKESGDLFDAIIKVARHHQPKFLLLENVANLPKHNNGLTWEHTFKRHLVEAGYNVEDKILSPHEFGIPQVRPRFFIVASRDSLEQFEWPEPTTQLSELSIKAVLDQKPEGAKELSKFHRECINVWQDFLDRFPKEEELPSFPIWSMEFGATYPFENATPFSSTSQLLSRRKGSHGIELHKFSPSTRLNQLPSHALTKQAVFPDWKIQFIRQNRELYQRHKDWIDDWLPQILKFPSSLQKLEWNCKGEQRKLGEHVLQIRASGLRVKRPTTAPALVAMTTSQVPIITWENRYMTTIECSRLQSLDDLSYFPKSSGTTYKALGNAVNAKLVRLIAEGLHQEGHSQLLIA